MGGDARIAGINASLAARGGLEHSARAFAADRRINPAPLNRLVNKLQSLDGARAERFQVDGKVGPAGKKH